MEHKKLEIKTENESNRAKLQTIDVSNRATTLSSLVAIPFLSSFMYVLVNIFEIFADCLEFLFSLLEVFRE